MSNLIKVLKVLYITYINHNFIYTCIVNMSQE